MGGEEIQLLLVEDNPGDVRLTLEAFREAKLLLKVHVVPDGIEALAFVRGEGIYAGSPRPDLILLDLNLPRKSGQDVLAEIKGDPSLKSIPVVVLTTSNRRSDIDASYLLHANCFISKPIDMPDFLRFVTSLSDFWFSLVKLPTGELV
jgi:CheY-like chemotaxis protein